MARKIRKENPELIELISFLKRASRENGARIWRDIAERLERPRRVWPEVNVSRIERYAKDGEVIVVPGRVLGAGILTRKVTVAAVGFTGTAREKIEGAGGKAMSIPELVEKIPKGSGVRIMG
jgi:large subunit ribosomal protein L18e